MPSQAHVPKVLAGDCRMIAGVEHSRADQIRSCCSTVRSTNDNNFSSSRCIIVYDEVLTA
eukprot:scaffold309058_cov32-Prasinocladus_malaysianus.AAC.1